MKIETKFNIGDEVWIERYNQPLMVRIIGIKVNVIKGCFAGIDERTCIEYDCNGSFHSFVELERNVFSTKEELLKSL